MFALFEEGSEIRAVRHAVDVRFFQGCLYFPYGDGVGYAVDVRDGDGGGGVSSYAHILEHEVGGLDFAAYHRRVGLDFLDEPFTRTFEYGGGGRFGDGALVRLAQGEHKETVEPFREHTHVPFRDFLHSVFHGKHGDVLTERGDGKEQFPHFVLRFDAAVEHLFALRHGRDDVLFEEQFVRKAVDVAEQDAALPVRDFAQEQVARVVEAVFDETLHFGCIHAHIIAIFAQN